MLKRSKVVTMAQIEAGVDGSQRSGIEVAFWAPKRLNSHVTPDDILFPYLQTVKSCTPAHLAFSAPQEPGVLRCGTLDIVLRVVRTVKRAATEG